MTTLPFRLHHIGIGSSSIEGAQRAFSALGVSFGDSYVDILQNANVSFSTSGGSHCTLELVENLSSDGPLANILKKVGAGPYHLCFEVDDIDGAFSFLRGRAFLVVREPVPAAAFDGRRICWLYSCEIGLIELLESSESKKEE